MMLYLRFGKTPKTVFNISDWFNTNFESAWFKDPFVARAVKEIDNSTIIGDRVVDCPVLGIISHREISSGTKTVVLSLFEPEREYNGSACGDNCAALLLEVARSHDVHLAFGHLMKFPEPFEIRVVNTGELVRTIPELLRVKLKVQKEDGS